MGAHPPEGMYPGPVGTKWANMRDSDGVIVSRNKPWPVLDGGPIVGAEPGFTMLRQVENVSPQHEEPYFVLVGTETPSPEAWELRKSWSLVDRPLEEVKAAVANVETIKSFDVIDREQEIINLRIIVLLLIDANKGIVFPERYTAMIEAFRAEALVLALNRDNRDELLGQIEAGQKPDLDAGWQVAVGEVAVP